MTSTIVHEDQLDRDGGWRLVRRTLGVRSFGVNLVEVAPGDALPEHDERERDQEELFLVLAGTPTIRIDGEEHELRPGTYVRLDPEPVRAVVNRGARPARLLVVSAPTTSGFTPMGWA